MDPELDRRAGDDIGWSRRMGQGRRVMRMGRRLGALDPDLARHDILAGSRIDRDLPAEIGAEIAKIRKAAGAMIRFEPVRGRPGGVALGNHSLDASVSQTEAEV